MSVNVCRCCMARPPDKDLKAKYSKRGKTVVYGDMLKECFEIQILKEGDDGGICDLCEMKLVDANEFKQQVQKCQKMMQKMAAAPVKVESKPKIKQEVEEDDDDEANDIYFLDVKEESDVEMRDEASADDDKNLAELFPRSVKRERKKTTAAGKKKADETVTGKPSSGLKISQHVEPKVTNTNLKIKMNIENIMKYSNALPFFTKTRAGVVCSYCVKTFKNKEELRAHINDAHKNKMVTNFRRIESSCLCFKVEITDLVCTICDKDFNGISSLKAHLIKDHHIKFHSDVKDYFCEFKLTSDNVNTCALCNKDTNSFVTLVQHMNSHYSNYKCKFCKVGFINIKALNPHESRCLAKSSDTNKIITESVKLKQASKSDCTKIKYNVENVLKYSNCTPFVNQTVAGILCAFCDSYLDDLQSMRAHVTEIHYKKHNYIDNYKRLTEVDSLAVKVDITDLACSICNINIDYISSLKEHLAKEHEIAFFTDVKDYFVEFKLPSNGIFSCVFCNSNFETLKSMRHHLSIHYNNFFCEICGVSFINKNTQRIHTKNLHSKGSYKCSTCSKVFSNKAARFNHEKIVHQKKARFKSKCAFCDVEFTDYYQRNRHLLKEHNTKAADYKCNVCEKTFLLKVELTRHMKRMHLMEKNHVCSYCGDRFFAKKDLTDHLLVHEPQDKIYKCDFCSKAYSRKKALSAHVKVHGSKRFKCGICYAEFHHKISLKSHMLSKHEKVEYQFFETVEDDNVDD